MPHGIELLEDIRSGPHIRVNIRPLKFDKTLTGSIGETQRIIEVARVMFRGWDYPHVDVENRASTGDYVHNWVDYAHFREYWRFYRSGQFVHLFAFREDGYREQCERDAGIQGVWPEEGLSVTGYLGVIATIYLITEIHEFAARLARGAGFRGGAWVSIALRDVGGRLLYLGGDPTRIFTGCYPAAEDQVTWERSHALDELLGNAAGLAVDACEYVLNGFGWHPTNLREFIAHEQQKLLAKQAD